MAADVDGWRGAPVALGRPALLRRWARLAAAGGAAGTAVEAAGRDVLTRYDEAGRAYHTVEHVGEVVGALEWLCSPDEVAPPVEFAAWFHDAVYDPRAAPGENEQASAEYASDVLGPLGIPPVVIAEAGRLILTTTTHAVDASDRHGAVLADADLWILGAPAPRYRRYADAVRREYAFVSDADWLTGRSALVSAFALRGRLYVTDRAHLALDAAARRNLAWELAALGGGEAQA